MQIIVQIASNGVNIGITKNSQYVPIVLQSVNYQDAVTAIIRNKYSSSDVEAIVNNYLLDTENEKYKKEFDEMQEYRLEAKSIAKKVVAFIQDNDLVNKPDDAYEIED